MTAENHNKNKSSSSITTETKASKKSAPEVAQGKEGVIPPEILEKSHGDPQEAAKLMRSVVSMEAFGTVGRHNPLVDKLNDDHISKILETAENDSQRDADQLTSQRRYTFAGFWIIVALFIFLVIYLIQKKQNEILVDLVQIMVALGGGFGAGYGVCFHRNVRKKS